MAAFAVAVKIDTIAYMPVQDFGNAFSVFVAQNYGADKRERISEGIRQALISMLLMWGQPTCESKEHFIWELVFCFCFMDIIVR